MDRLEHELSRKPLHDAFAPTQGLAPRPTRSSESVETAAVESEWAPETGPRFRLDHGFHQTQSRWLRRGPSGVRVKLAGSSRCATIVASREARILAAMVNWIIADEQESAAISADAEDCLAVIGGPTATHSAGLVRFSPSGLPWGQDYLLMDRDAAQEDWHADLAPGSRLVERYSLAPGLDWWAGDLKGVRGCYRFRAYRRGEFCTEVRLQVPGSDQVLPALAAVAIGTRMRLAPSAIKERLEDFSGVPRGFESRGSFRGATLVDDEALGSGAVGKVLRLAREVFGQRTIRVIYLPHLTGAAEVEWPLPSEFAEANQLILIDPAPIRPESTRLLAAGLRSSGVSLVICASLTEAIREFDRYLEPGDVLVTLGAGEVGTIADAFLRRLSRDRHG